MNTETLRVPQVARVVVAMTLATLLAAFALHPVAHATEKPTIVLVHGAFADPSSWNDVVPRLKKDGFATVTPRLDLVSVAGDVAIVRAALDGIAGDKVLVGHSYGGFVISNAAAGRTDVVALVYTAAYVPAPGESIFSVSEGWAPPAFLQPGHLLFVSSTSAIIDPAFFRGDFAQDLNPKRAAVMAAAQQAVALDILFTPSGPVAWQEGIPSWYAVSAADRVIDPALQRFMASRAGSATVEFDDASHAGGFTHYAARFTKLIEDAAQAA
jgi:pimeloyl-ACP methyl ester carboxylesterase